MQWIKHVKWVHKLNTVFYKMILSYIVLILFTIIFVGVTSYHYFSTSFNEQVEKVNSRILHSVSQNIVNNVSDIVEGTYLDTVTGDPQSSPTLFLFDNPIEGNHSKIQESYHQLKAAVAGHSDVLDSISIFYKSNNIMISSKAGVSYLDQSVTVELDWLEQAKLLGKNTLWIEARKVRPNILSDSHSANLISFVRPYPYTSSPENVKGYVAIHVNEKTIRNFMQIAPNDSSEMLLLKEDGKVLSTSRPDRLFDPISEQLPYIRSVLSSKNPADNFIQTDQDVRTMISYITVPTLNWKLISMTSVDDFYQKTTPLRNSLLLICFIAILMGVIISNVFTLSIYNPIKPVIQKARHLFEHGKNQSSSPEDEFKIIDNVINNLSVKVHQLEHTLSTNMPLIKHHLVHRLLYQTILTEEELLDRTKLLHLELTGPHFYVLLFRMASDQMGRLTLENSQFVKYNLIDQMEKKRPGQTVLAAQISEFEIGMVLSTRYANVKGFLGWIHEMQDYVQSNFMIQTSVFIGTQTHSPLDLCVSFRDSQAITKYQYFLPSETVFLGDIFLEREHCTDEISEELLKKFSGELRSNQLERVRETLKRLIQAMKTGKYSSDHCHQRCRDLVDQFRGYIKDIHLKTQDFLEPGHLEQIQHIRNIDEFEAWLNRTFMLAFQYIEQRSSNKNKELIETAKTYISTNLNAPLSLDLVAEQVGISPRYLSKLFKEISGMNFSDYITQQRIQKACELILIKDLTVEQISAQVGFNSSAYFIKKFKEMYGVTPNNYRHNFLLKDL